MKRGYMLVIYKQRDGIDLLLFKGHAAVRHRAFCESEKPQNRWRSIIDPFVGKIKPQRALLILSRAEVLQKNMPVPFALAPEALPEFLDKRISHYFPYSAGDMAFDLSFYRQGSGREGLLYAIPATKLKGILDGIGYAVDEIATDDQALTWYVRSTKEQTAFYVLAAGSRKFFQGLSKALEYRQNC